MNFTALALLSASLGVGQPAAVGGDYQVTKARSLQIGIDYKPERKKDIRSVVLYMSRDMGSTWELVAQEPPTKAAFNFTAPDDGVYFMSMMIMYMDGKTDPPDVSRVPPAQKLIIDSTKPVVKIHSAQRNGDDVMVEWNVEDKNPNDSTTKVFYRAATAGDSANWQTVPVESMNKRSVKFAANMAGPLLVQVVTADLAGNVGAGNREVAAAGTTTTASYAPPTVGIGPPPVQARAAVDITPAPPVTIGDAPLPPPTLGTGVPTMPTQPVIVSHPPAIQSPPMFAPVQQYIATVGASPSSVGVMQVVVEPPLKTIASSGTVPLAVPSTGAVAGPEVSPIQYSKTPRFELGYQLEAGPSGVARTDLYVTRDDGKNWIRWSTHDGRESPLKVVLDTRFNQELDGEYGFKLVPVSGAGLSEGAPVAGSHPDARVLVDTVAPVVKVYQPTADPVQKNALVLHWEATDKNFGKDPLTIEYSEGPNGPWKAISNNDSVIQAAAGTMHRIPNTGSFAWQLPTTLITPKVYLKFTVWDLAGNKSEVATPNPVLVDLKKPTARVQGITGGR